MGGDTSMMSGWPLQALPVKDEQEATGPGTSAAFCVALACLPCTV